MHPNAGRTHEAPFVAFGDDSIFEDILLYGFVICRREQLPNLRADIEKLKQRIGLRPDIPIHVKDLLSGQYRKKNNIHGFEKTQQSVFFRKAIDTINKNKCIVRYCYTIIPKSGKIYNFE